MSRQIFQSDNRPDKATAFRLPTQLLAKIDSICQTLDCSRSQLFRRSIKDYISELDRLQKETT